MTVYSCPNAEKSADRLKKCCPFVVLCPNIKLEDFSPVTLENRIVVQLGNAAERRRWRMLRGGVGAAVEKRQGSAPAGARSLFRAPQEGTCDNLNDSRVKRQEQDIHMRTPCPHV